MITGCAIGDEPAPFRVDHATAAAGPSEPAPVDPAAGLLTRAWQANLRGGGSTSPRLFTFTPGQLLMFSPRGVDARATRDGAARWHYYEPGRVLTGYALTGGTLVLVTQGREGNDPSTVGLDAATGEELWRSTSFRSFRPRLDGKIEQPSGQGVAVLADGKDSSVLVGVDARTGERRWTWSAREPGAKGTISCDYEGHDSDGTLLPIVASCSDSEFEDQDLIALDPRTGSLVWQRLARPDLRGVTGDMRWATSRAGLTLAPVDASGFRGVVLTGRDGRELTRLRVQSKSAPRAGSLAVTGGRAMLQYEIGESPGGYLTSVDLRTGKARKPVPKRITGELAVGAAGHVYGLRKHLSVDNDQVFDPATPLPGGVEAIDPRTLEIRHLPLSSTAVSGFWDLSREPPIGYRVLMSGGRVYVAEDVPNGLRLTAYAPGAPVSPPELGGVRAGDWPDACQLGAGPDNAAPPSPEPPLKVGSQGIPHWSCRYLLGERGEEFGVWTAWVARDAAEADRMLNPADSPGLRALPITGLGDEAYSLPDRLGHPLVALRVGRYITMVEAVDHADPESMAKIVARNLKRLT